MSAMHRRRSSVNFGGARHFCPKIHAWKINKMPEFYMIFARKINKMPKFYMIFARNIFPEFFSFFGGGSKCPRPPRLLRLWSWGKRTVMSSYWCIERRQIETSTCISALNVLYSRNCVIRTLLDRNFSTVTEEEDRKREEQQVQAALSRCGCPKCSINKVKKQTSTPKQKKVSRKPTK